MVFWSAEQTQCVWTLIKTNFFKSVHLQVTNWYSCDLAIHRFSLCMMPIPPSGLDGNVEESISYPSGFRAALPTPSPSLSHISVIAHMSRSRSLMNCFIRAVLLLQDLWFIRQTDNASGLGTYLFIFLMTFLFQVQWNLEAWCSVRTCIHLKISFPALLLLFNTLMSYPS